MELLIINLTEPISVLTWDKYLYILIVIEVSYYYMVSYLLKNKEKASIAIQSIVTIIKCWSSLKAYQFQSKNSSKFVKKSNKTILLVE